MTTRAGSRRYDFTFRESFIRPGIGCGNWTSRTNYPALGVVQTGASEMSLYVQREYAQPTAYLERFVLRLDGFSSVRASFDGGEVLTRPFTFSGRALEINYSTSAAVGAPGRNPGCRWQPCSRFCTRRVSRDHWRRDRPGGILAKGRGGRRPGRQADPVALCTARRGSIRAAL